jgi:predicted transporter
MIGLQMAEPVTTTAVAGMQVGLAALLVGALGAVGADVMMVVLSAIAGCFITLSSDKPPRALGSALFFICKGILLSAVLAWAVSSVAAKLMPALDSPYSPAIVAFVIGFSGDKLPLMINKVLTKVGLK